MSKLFRTSLYIFLFAFFLQLPFISAKPKLSAVIITVDQYDDAESNNIAESVRIDFGALNNFLNIIEKRNLFTVERKLLKGNSTGYANIIREINNISTGNDDIILVYFSGHGGMDSKGTFVVTKEGELFYRKDIEKILNSKSARLKILLTDACSNSIDGITLARSFRSSRSAMDGQNDAAYKKLLGSYKGLLNISASSEGEYAWSDDNMGGFFTYYFIKEGLTKGASDRWDELFNKAKTKVMQTYNQMPSDQRTQLASEGINNQTPKAYSLPSLVGSSLTTITPEPIQINASIKIMNKTGKTISYYYDENYFESGPSNKELKKLSISSNKTISLNKLGAIYFNSGIEEIGYELEEGNFYFQEDRYGKVDLIMEGLEDDVIQTDFSTELIADWIYDIDNQFAYLSFYEDNSFEVYSEDDELIDDGEWEIQTENIDGETYSTLILSYPDGVEVFYDVANEDEYSIKLTLLQEVKGYYEMTSTVDYLYLDLLE